MDKSTIILDLYDYAGLLDKLREQEERITVLIRFLKEAEKREERRK